MAAIMRVVSGVGGATVLDLNAAAGGGIMNDRGEKVLAQTELTDGDIGNARSWWSPMTSPSEIGSRRISIPLTVQGTSQDDVAARVQALNAAVDQPFVLEVRRHGATQSGFLRCWPAAPQVAAQVNGVGSSLFAKVALVADTEPYAVGAMVDTGALTFAQDPASSAFVADVNGVAGDALAPCLLRTNLTGLGITTHGSVWGIRRRGTPSSLTGLTVQGEARTSVVAGTNVTMSTVTGDSALSGSQGQRITYSASATTDVSNAGSALFDFALPPAEANGIYRLLARVRRGGSGAGDEHTIRVTLGAYEPQDYLMPAGGVDLRVVDLGLVQVPTGQPAALSAPVAGDRGAAASTITLKVWKSGTTGAGTFDIDWVTLVPADEDGGLWRTSNAASLWAYADGYDGTAGFADLDLATSTAAVMQGMAAGTSTIFLGGIPRLRPGDNRLYCVQGGTSAVIWPKTTSFTVRAAYWPRYRWLP